MPDPLLLTVDVEWYYNGNRSGSTADFGRRSLDERMRYDNGKVEDSVRFILEALAKSKKHITFFAIAELDEAIPSLLAEIRSAGHEIGLHSYRHDDLHTVDELERELHRCLAFKEKYDVVSFRAPRIDIKRSFYQVLHNYRFLYDSSVYGSGSYSLDGVRVVPVAALPLRRKLLRKVPCNLGACVNSASIPFGSGIAGPIGFWGYRHLIRRYGRRYREAPCLFLHSWQVRQPHYPIRFFVRNPAMYPYSLECKNLFERLCSNYEVVPIREYFGE